MRVATIVGARPQFVKASAVSRAIGEWNRNRPKAQIDELIVHTGQHFDHNMSQAFFTDLRIPEPRYNLGIAGGSHGEMTGRMLADIEAVLVRESPDFVLVYGDTNSTLAGALAAVKLHVPVAHVEAGLRSYNMRMPEEVNRVLADRISTLLFCPTRTAVANLAAEGMTTGVHEVGDVMFDAALHFADAARRQSSVLERNGLGGGRPFVLATCHRAENTEEFSRLAKILDALCQIGRDSVVVLPLHPRTRKAIESGGLLPRHDGILLIEPQPFLDMLNLEQHAQVIVTDSGGVQKEAYFFGVPCVTVREETEWVETVQLGANVLVGVDPERIVAAFRACANRPRKGVPDAGPFGDGHASARIVALLSAAG